ncbi:PadR family transcriptional regulator [Cohnella panacarvi]|uniref:PadR family transcriptional regulator n=1 Tax=Cohnella panacarvi TaxID=400776 RepID=UPI00047BC0DD|nr:PadR family transcriptional regulator [Cohnella panacarvi]
MDVTDREIWKGSIDIILLSIIGKGPTYGYEIIQNLRRVSEQAYEMSEGTLYPALRRLEEKQLLTSSWGDSETGGRRKYYEITEEGRHSLAGKLQQWRLVSRLISISAEGMG